MFNRLIAPYRAFLLLPDVKQTLVITFFSRLPVGMMALSMVMFLRDSLGNFKLAGSVLGVYFFAMAVAAPVQGRIIDRIGPNLPLKITGIGEPIFFGLFIAAVWNSWPISVIIALTIAMGIFSPPITTLTRTLWRHRFDSDDDRRMAFSVDSVLMEINFTLGPAFIGVLLAFTNPRVAVIAAWVGLSVSIIAFMRSPALKYWKQEDNVERHFMGPLTDPKLVLLFVIVLGLTTACGLLEVGYPAYATWLVMPAFAGGLLAVNSLGSVVGGALFGAMKWRMSLERQFALLLAIFAVLMCLHLAVDAKVTPYLFALMAFIAGFAISPAFASQAMLISRIAPAKYATEAFTWSGTFIVTGLGAGMAVGGALSEIYFVKAPFVAGSAVLLIAAMLALLLKVRPVPQH
jgi:MFS family permease